MKIFILQAIRLSIRIAMFVLCVTETALSAVSLSPQISLGTTYTDNVHLSPNDKQSDFISAITPGASIAFTDRNSALTLIYNPTYAVYTRFPENNNVRHDAQLDFQNEIASGTRITLRNNYLYTEDPVSDIDTTIRQGRRPYFTNTTGLGIVNQFGQQDSIALRYEYFILDNRDPTVEDRNYQRPNLLITYWLSPNLYATETEFKYTYTDFEHTEDIDEISGRFRFIRRFSRHFDGYLEYTYLSNDHIGEGEDYHTHSPLIGFHWEETFISSFSSSFGYYYRDNARHQADSGFIGSMESVYRWDVLNSCSLSGSAGQDSTSASDTENLGFRKFYNISFLLNYQFSQYLTGSISTGYRRDIYLDQNPERENSTWRGRAGVSFQAFPWLTLHLDYFFRKLKSEIEANNYTENRGMISVALKPQREITLSH